jgi:diguanylate cyclase (GGDEF)-like protein/PAS domain S-box-containing protein
LLAGTALTVLVCAGAAVDPAVRVPADGAVALFGVLSAALLWSVAGRQGSRRRNWRLLAAAPLFPALGGLLVALVQPSDVLQSVVLRWIPAVPGYALGIVGVLGLAGRERLRSGGLRSVVELALFLAGCLTTVQLLVLGPDRQWGDLRPAETVVLAAAVVVTSASIAAALTHLAVVEPGRQRAALVLLAGTILLTSGRGLGTSARLMQALSVLDASRFLVIGGLALYVLAGLLDARPDPGPVRPAVSRTTKLGQLLPHIEMVVATAAVVANLAMGRRTSLSTLTTLAVCVLLAAVHRCLTMREERRLAGRLRRSEAYFRSLVRSSADAVLILDGHLRVSWASPALERMVGGASARALVGRPLLDVVHPEDVAALAEALPGASPHEGTEAVGLQLFRLRDDDGEWRFLEAGLSDMRRDTDVGAVVLHCRDMTERLAREQALQSVAYTDPMTGLPNSAGWVRSLESVVAEAGADQSAVLLIELEGIPEAREHAGREAVTAVVAEIGRRLRATVRGEDLVARLGGGAFAVVAVGTPDEADLLASRCLAVVEQPIATGGGVLELTAGIGVAAVEPGLSVDELRARVELAARAAHAAGPGTAVQYSERLGDAAARRDRLRGALPGAAGRGELSLAFLPVVALADQHVRGVEALVRWRHPELGQVPPTEFLPVAEAAGVIGPVQRWVLNAATEAAMGLPASLGPLRIGVNLSRGYLRGGTVVADVQAALDASGLAAERLVLEITDAALLAADERVGLDVASLRLMGVHVALDDFGTGDSALGHLTALPLDVLKLDVSLVARVDKDPQALALCRSIIDIGQALGLQVAAEGVETPAQLAALLGLGCEFAQGFLLARPMSLSALTDILTDRAGQLWPGLVGQR